MCLILFAFKKPKRSDKGALKSSDKFILMANRDEYYDRPTSSMNWLHEDKSILSGKDNLAGGTWLGFSKDGKFAAITNYRETLKEASNLKSRGNLVLTYLKTPKLLARDYILGVEKQKYAGFSLLLGDKEGVHCLSNRSNRIWSMNEGIHILGNRLIDKPTEKINRVRADLEKFLEKQFDHSNAMKFMQVDQGDLTGISPDEMRSLEKEELPFRFIKSDLYGTRCTTVFSINASGLYKVTEQTYGRKGRMGELKDFKFTL